jgi:TonB family protein
MTRLQKKCLIATAGSHLLVIVALFCSGFIKSTPKPDETQLLTVIPSTLIDAMASSGSKAPEPPKQQPIAQPPEPTPPPPEPPKTVAKPVEQVKQPDPEPPKPVERLKPDDLAPMVKVEKKPTPKQHEIKVELKPVVRKTPKNTPDNSEAEAQAEAKAQQKARDAKLRAIANAARSIRDNSSSSTSVEMPGPGSVSYANYASAIKSIYDNAWKSPEDMSDADVNVRVSIVISRDGRVISARILNRSGDARVDASVQRALDRVDSVPPFPEGAKERERTFIINFNPQARRMTG